jgi:hypothetical protein
MEYTTLPAVGHLGSFWFGMLMLSAALHDVPLGPAAGCPNSKEDTTFAYPPVRCGAAM